MKRSVSVAWLLLASLGTVAIGCSDDSADRPAGPQLDTDVTQLNFGQDVGEATYVGTEPINTLQVFNAGTEDLTLTAASISGNRFYFGTSAPELPVTLAPNDRTFIQVTFGPDAPGLFEGTLTLTSNSAGAPTTEIALSGKGVSPP